MNSPNINQQIYLITFGNQKYYKSLERLKQQAININFFNDIYTFTDNDLRNDSNFWETHKHFIENNNRGYGYWLWKSYIIEKILNKINMNDIIIYMDAGCSINSNGINRLKEYINIVNNNNYGIITFELTSIEKCYTKMHLFEYLNCIHFKDSRQLMATSFILRKCDHTINTIREWKDLCYNYNLINDNYCNVKNDESFIDHRHDQSIFSLVNKKNGSIIISDETYFYPDWDTHGKLYPIWATRLV